MIPKITIVSALLALSLLLTTITVMKTYLVNLYSKEVMTITAGLLLHVTTQQPQMAMRKNVKDFYSLALKNVCLILMISL